MSLWMYLWITLLVAGTFGMVGLLLTVTAGAFGELRQMLAELQPIADESSAESVTTAGGAATAPAE